MRSIAFTSFVGILLAVVTSEAQDIIVHVSSHVEYVITDSRGRRTGFDPVLDRSYSEINNSYGVSSIDSEDPNMEPPEPVNEFMSNDPVDGTYHLKLFGTKLAGYRLVTGISRGPGDGKTFEFIGVIDSNGVQEYEFNYSSIPGVPFQATKSTNGNILRQDFENCYRLKLLGNKSVYKELSNRISQIERRFGQGDSSKAYEELKRLGRQLKKVKEETEKHEQRKQKSDRFITKEACDILAEDITILESSFSSHWRHDKGGKRLKSKDDQRKD